MSDNELTTNDIETVYEVIISPNSDVFRADQAGELRRIAVPGSYRVTFGPIAPKATEMVVRIWDDKSLKMVIRDVESVRDTALRYMVKRGEWEGVDDGEAQHSLE